MANHNAKDGSCPSCGTGGANCCSGPGRWTWMILAVAIVGVLVAKNAARKTDQADSPSMDPTPAAMESAPAQSVQAPVGQGRAVPRLLDLGATKCIPCKMMAPILDELKETYAGKLDVAFIDVWENPEAAKKYGINMIPTQIFYDATGKERFRHEGFFAREDILAKWKEFGVDLSEAR